MNHDTYEDPTIIAILRRVKSIAIVGASANPARPSYFVMKYMLDKGFQVTPVNPGQAGKEILGRMTYATLADVPEPIDMVDIFRASETVPGVVDEVMGLTPLPTVIWMQLSVRHDEAAARAERAGLQVIMNRCPKIEYARLAGEIKWSGVNSGIISSKRPSMLGRFQSFGLRSK